MPKKKTHEDYVTEVNKKNPNIEVLGTYIDARTKIMHKCKKHNIDWMITPNDVLRGYGCKICKSEKTKLKQKKSNSQYIEELKGVNLNIIPIEEYITANTSIDHKCLICNYIWKAKPSNLLNNSCHCPRCSKRFRRTNEDYISELSEKFINITPLEKFHGMRVPILHKCTIHNITWKSSPENILKGHGCIECGKEKIKYNKTKTTSDYINNIKEKNLNIAILEEYKGAETSIKHKCTVCGYIWMARPGNILYGKGCPNCARNIKRTQEQYKNDVREINPNINVVEKYINANTPILHKCLIHNITWKASPSSILNGCGCNMCGKDKLKESNSKSHEQYLAELKNIRSNIVPIERYNGANTSILHKCLIHDYVWKTTPSYILNSRGNCPKCSIHRSKGEIEICEWLQSHNISYEIQHKYPDCKDIRELPFDVYIPDRNCCIEFDGLQHEKPILFFGGQEGFDIRQKHDKIKDEYCKNNDISLLRISYNQNIEEELNNFLFN